MFDETPASTSGLASGVMPADSRIPSLRSNAPCSALSQKPHRELESAPAITLVGRRDRSAGTAARSRWNSRAHCRNIQGLPLAAERPRLPGRPTRGCGGRCPGLVRENVAGAETGKSGALRDLFRGNVPELEGPTYFCTTVLPRTVAAAECRASTDASARTLEKSRTRRTLLVEDSAPLERSRDPAGPQAVRTAVKDFSGCTSGAVRECAPAEPRATSYHGSRQC
jgi:hypothetical protein